MPQMSSIQTACTYDCPDACGLLVKETGGKLQICGDPAHPITRGYRCYRIKKHLARLDDPMRLTQPLIRNGECWSEIGWGEALDIVAEKLQDALTQEGPPSIVYMRGGGSLGLSKNLVDHFFHTLGPVTTVRGGVCGEAGEAAQHLDFGDVACHDYTDLAHTQAIVLWGKNPVVSGMHLVPFIREARQRGAPVFLIDPLPTESRKLADRFIQPAPSGDGFLALAILRTLHQRGALSSNAIARTENFNNFKRLLTSPDLSVEICTERAGVTQTDVDALVDLYEHTSPVATWVGWGLQRQLSGGRNLRCIDALGLLTGNVGIPGGGVNYSSTRSRGLDRSHLTGTTGRTITAPRFGKDLDALNNPPARLVYLVGANPVTQFADSRCTTRALQTTDFVVVHDAFFTDTAAAADLILPPKLMLEEDDVVGSYQHHHVATVRTAVDPPPGVLGDLEILQKIADRLGRPADPVIQQPHTALAQMTAPWFEDRADRSAARNTTHRPVPFSDAFPTPSGKARLIDAPPALVPKRDGFPLVLLSVSSRRWQTSQLSESEQSGLPECTVHPSVVDTDAVQTGSYAQIVSPIGEMKVRLRLDPLMRPEVCLIHRGGWVRHGRCVNTLIEAKPTDLGEGTAFLQQRVRLELA